MFGSNYFKKIHNTKKEFTNDEWVKSKILYKQALLNIFFPQFPALLNKGSFIENPARAFRHRYQTQQEFYASQAS